MAESSPYDHRYHAGNHGDVWKHVAWLAALAAFKRERLVVVDTHGGRGEYALPARGGEWLAGIGRLREAWPPGRSSGSGAVDRYLARTGREERYPGSPLLAARALGRSDQLLVYEQDEGTARALRAALGPDGRFRVIQGDGWAVPALAEPPGTSEARTLVLIDPPFVEKADWERVPSALERAWRAGHAAMAWYPIKRLTRPGQLLSSLRDRGVPHVALELLLTPIELTGERMAGSGLLLVSLPESVSLELHAAAPVLGAALATTSGRWSLRSGGFSPS